VKSATSGGETGAEVGAPESLLWTGEAEEDNTGDLGGAEPTIGPEDGSDRRAQGAGGPSRRSPHESSAGELAIDSAGPAGRPGEAGGRSNGGLKGSRVHADSIEESSTGPAEGGRGDPAVGRTGNAQQASVPEGLAEGVDTDRVLAGEESQPAEGGGDASDLLE